MMASSALWPITYLLIHYSALQRLKQYITDSSIFRSTVVMVHNEATNV